MENEGKTKDAAENAASETTKPVVEKRQPAFVVEADGRRTRTLVKPIITHEGLKAAISLRKPTYRDIMNNGDPESLVVVNGGYVPQIDMFIIERYIAALSGIDPALLEQIDYMDALALRDAVRSFFQ